ncbi:MAG TPA: cyclic nucleotide-binding domain-containing protein [Actinomycetota bacterium]|nr:cyclic nucleotide-binding domain-containing protein [Actinomycetota bacterium]
MRISSSVTSLSWIPSEAVTGAMKMPFEVGVAHYDDPPPDVLDDLNVLREQDRFRFANELHAWIDVDDGAVAWGGRSLRASGPRIRAHGQSGAGHIGSTTLRLGGRAMTFPAVPYPTLQRVETGPDFVRFIQTAGGRTGVPAPRPVKRPPFFRLAAPTAWTTLALTLYANGRAEHEVIGASPFPRHWVYDATGKLVSKSGLIDFKDWAAQAFGRKTPWGEEDAPALVTAVETSLERMLSTQIMRGATPKKRKLRAGATLVEQGSPGNELFLLLDGVLSVEVDGKVLAEIGPGAILGERAILEGGTRTSTLRARTACTVAVAAADAVDRDALVEVARGHRREEALEG